MVRLRRYPIPALMCLVGFFIPHLTAGGEPRASQDLAVDHSGEIVWFDESPTRALFLPQEVLRRTPLEELPIGQHDLGRVQYAIDFPSDRRKHGFRKECLHEEEAGGPFSARSRKTLEEWVAERSLAFVGTVVEAVLGWSVLDQHPTTLVYVRVDEVLRDAAKALRVGEIVAYTQDQATIDLYGVSACSRLPQDAYLAAPGEEVLFTGTRFLEHPFFLTDMLTFPVLEGEVLPQPSALIETTTPQSLTKVREALFSGGEK